MARLISSRLTFVQKFLTPVAAPVIAGLIVWWSFRGGLGAEYLLFLAAAAAMGLVFFFLTGWPAKVVRIDDENLYVSNYRREITIPISDIESVSDFVFSGEPRRVTVTLKHPSEFGSTIVFLAKFRFVSGFDAHPIVDELTRRAAGKHEEFYPSLLNLP